MRSRQIGSADSLRTHVVVFETGDDAVAGLAAFARSEAISGASLSAVGAFRRAVVGWFDVEARGYRRIEVDEQVEVLSLAGDITDPGPGADPADPTVHLHAVLGRRDGSTVGGHLLEAEIRPTLEVVVSETPSHIRRRLDPATGLALIDLGATEPAGPSRPGPHGGHPDGQDRS